ncbi:MAG: diadenylate cyclase [Candidatus Aenigmatarchaeota archaeon]
MRQYVFNGSVFVPDGPVEYKSIDYSDVLCHDSRSDFDTSGIAHEALLSAMKDSIPGKHTGTLVVVANIFGNKGKLPLAEILNEERPDLGRVYAKDPEELSRVLLEISDKSSPFHDGAIIIDDDTSRVLDCNVLLIPPPFINGSEHEEHYRGTRHKTAVDYSRLSTTMLTCCLSINGENVLKEFRRGAITYDSENHSPA